MTLSRSIPTKPKSATASKEQAQKKVYVLDTNVLLADPQAAVHGFAEHNVVIPGAVLEELDKIKVEHDSERGRNAREVHRILLATFPDAASMRDGVRLPSGGTLSVVIPDDLDKIENAATRTIAADLRKRDNQILLTALYVAATFPPPTILVTSDANVALKARALGLEAQDYRNEKVSREEVREGGATEIPLTTSEFQGFASKGEGEFADGSARFEHNEYCIVRSESGQQMPARSSSAKSIARLRTADSISVPGGRTVRPKNVEQQFLMDALLDPSIRLITARGPAGTGKTLLAIAAAVEQTIGKNRLYDSVLISRPVAMVGKDIGFLPGTIEDKMKPHLQAYFDALNFLFPVHKDVGPQFAAMKASQRKKSKKQKGDDSLATASGSIGSGLRGMPTMKPYEQLLQTGALSIEALTFIRGRSIPNAFFILDESQNLSRGEIKTVITRMSEGSKLVLLGDEHQIDNPFVDRYSNGLVHAATRMKDLPYAAHIVLTQGQRSDMAEDGAKRL